MRESREHAALVELFRHHPELAARLAERHAGASLPASYTTHVADAIHRPANLAADLVIEVRDVHGKVVLAISVEVQRTIDEMKLYTWPAYLWLERLRRRCDSCVLVIATRKSVAAWARRVIRGGPFNEMRVIVLGPADVPRITDPQVARANPALAVLSAAMHATAPDGFPVARAAVAALASLPYADTREYNHLVFHTLHPDTIREILEDVMQEQYECHHEDDGYCGWREFCSQLRAMGKEEGKAEGREEGKAEAAVHMRAEILLRLLGQRGLAVDEMTRSRVLACTDVELLDVWLGRVLSAGSTGDVFAA